MRHFTITRARITGASGFLAACVMALTVPGIAGASHAGATLNATSERDAVPIGRYARVLATLSTAPVAPVVINADIEGANGEDTDPSLPDESCSVAGVDDPATKRIDESVQCRILYSGTQEGVDRVRLWIADEGADETEKVSIRRAGGTAPEPDGTDVVERQWFTVLFPGTTLDCGPDKPAVGTVKGTGSNQKYMCSVRNAGGPLSGVTIDGEHLGGANDPDNSSAAGTVDYNNACTTDADGHCTFTVTSRGEAGSATICFFTDDDHSAAFSPSGREYNGGACDEAVKDSAANRNRTDTVSKSWKYLRTVSLDASKDSVRVGRSVTFSGSVRSGGKVCKSNVSVKIQRNPAGGDNKFSSWKTATTGFKGGYRVSAKPRMSAKYRSILGTTPKCRRARSAVERVGVRP